MKERIPLKLYRSCVDSQLDCGTSLREQEGQACPSAFPHFSNPPPTNTLRKLFLVEKKFRNRTPVSEKNIKMNTGNSLF